MKPCLPAFPDFATLAAGPTPRRVPLVRRLLSDALTPVLGYRRLVRGDDRLAPSFLLESVVGGERVGRYSYLGSRPAMEVIARGHDVELRELQEPEVDRALDVMADDHRRDPRRPQVSRRRLGDDRRSVFPHPDHAHKPTRAIASPSRSYPDRHRRPGDPLSTPESGARR